MVTAAYDVSNLVALYKDGLQCETCCLFATSDCTCFAGSVWDNSTAYVIGDTVFYDGIYYNCRTGNTNNEPSTNPNEWTYMSPYGGAGGTPAQISIVVWDVVLCGVDGVRDPNGTHILDIDTAAGEFPCRYTKLIPRGGGFSPMYFFANLSTGQVSIASIDTASMFVKTGSPCLLRQVFSNNLTECNWNPPFHTQPPPFAVGHSGTIQWRMGACDAWDSGDNYIIGDCVGHEGVFYICNQDHINQEPPNGSYWAPIVV